MLCCVSISLNMKVHKFDSVYMGICVPECKPIHECESVFQCAHLRTSMSLCFSVQVDMSVSLFQCAHRHECEFVCMCVFIFVTVCACESVHAGV